MKYPIKISVPKCFGQYNPKRFCLKSNPGICDLCRKICSGQPFYQCRYCYKCFVREEEYDNHYRIEHDNGKKLDLRPEPHYFPRQTKPYEPPIIT